MQHWRKPMTPIPPRNLRPNQKSTEDQIQRSVVADLTRRLESCNPPIILDDHVGKIQRIGSTILDGVNFYARDYKKLKQTLLDAKDGGGGPFFAHAILENDDHWALKMSFLATDGTGFRE